MLLKNKLIQKIKLPKILDDCSLIFGQENDHIPFKIKRVFYILYSNPKLPRGYHAHKKTKQVLFCVQGSIRLILNDGKQKKEIILDRPNVGIFINNMVWHQMHDFKKNTILLILASTNFDEKDYIRDYDKFKKRVS